MAEDLRRLNKEAATAVSDFLRRSSITYLEACISLMLTGMSVKETADILEQEARDLRELG